MSKFFIDLIANVVGNVIAWLLLGVVTLYFVKRRSQARFEKIFGLVHRRKVIVYLSNLWDPTRTDRPWGRILSGQEFNASQSISRLFGVSPFSLPELVRGFVDAFFIGRRIEVDIDVSPMDDGFDTNNNLIVVGSTLKNAVRRVYAGKTAVHLIIEGELTTNDTIDIHSNHLKNRFEVIAGANKGDNPQHSGLYELAIIERVREKNRVIFFCAGMTGDGSRAAVEYLARNWEHLWREYNEHSFALCLWFLKQDICGTNPSWEPAHLEPVR